jgi:hypothetical protein
MGIFFFLFILATILAGKRVKEYGFPELTVTGNG